MKDKNDRLFHLPRCHAVSAIGWYESEREKNRERSHASSLLKGKCLSDLPSMIDLCVSIDLREFLEFSEIKEIQMKRQVGS